MYRNSDQDYKKFYERITAPFAGHPGRVRAMRALNRILTAMVYAAYPVLLIRLYTAGSEAFWRAVLVPGISFVILSLVRRLINRPRPYERWEIRPLIHKNTHGKSMPSRHVFSTAVIAMVYLYFYPGAGVFFLLCGAAGAVIRVIGGVHYPSDVIAGFAAGAAAGIFMFV
ncbi:MAG: phosphatase PAP2 family protein [Lachnospiraceae bacterium]|jgi:membrane-associated phospholipid phosphatase